MRKSASREQAETFYSSPARVPGVDSRFRFRNLFIRWRSRAPTNKGPAPAAARRFRFSKIGAAGDHWRTEGSREKGSRCACALQSARLHGELTSAERWRPRRSRRCRRGTGSSPLTAGSQRPADGHLRDDRIGRLGKFLLTTSCRPGCLGSGKVSRNRTSELYLALGLDVCF